MCKNKSLLTQFVLFFLMLLAFTSCARTYSRNRGPTPIARPLPRARPSVEPVPPRQDVPRLAGNWQITEVSPLEETPRQGGLQDLLRQNANLVLRIPNDTHASIEITLENGCRAWLEFNIDYCCPRMRRLFVRLDQATTRSEPEGCFDSALIENDLLPTYHFVFGYRRGPYVTLMGPFSGERDDFSRAIHLEPLAE